MRRRPSIAPPVLTLEQCFQIFGERSVRKGIAQREIVFHRLGQRSLIPTEDVVAWVRAKPIVVHTNTQFGASPDA